MFDTNFLLIVQIAIIGIILVAGMFLIWRSILRLEEKVDKVLHFSFSISPPTDSSCKYVAKDTEGYQFVEDEGKYSLNKNVDKDGGYNEYEYDDGDGEGEGDEDEDEDEQDEQDEQDEEEYMNDPETIALMKSVFGDPRANMMGNIVDGNSPLIMVFSNTNTNVEDLATPPSVPSVVIQDIPDSSVASDTAHPMSKTKLKKLTMDQLREYCTGHQLPTDGTKQQLVDRILMHMNDGQ